MPKAGRLRMRINPSQTLAMKKTARLTIATAICISLFTGCAGGPGISEARNSGGLAPRGGNGMVLVYWQSGFVSAAFKPTIYVNGQQLPKRLQRGGFLAQEVAPGTVNVAFSQQPGESTSKTQSQAIVGGVLSAGILGGLLAVPGDKKAHTKHGVDVSVLPNGTTYVMMVGAGGSLKEVPKETGEREIEKCHWLNPSGR
jgi:hypothetical protein